MVPTATTVHYRSPGTPRARPASPPRVDPWPKLKLRYFERSFTGLQPSDGKGIPLREATRPLQPTLTRLVSMPGGGHPASGPWPAKLPTRPDRAALGLSMPLPAQASMIQSKETYTILFLDPPGVRKTLQPGNASDLRGKK